MRAPADMPPRRRRRSSGRGRIVLVVVAVAVFVLFTSLRGIAGFYTDYLWFDGLGRSDVWSGMLEAKLLLGALFSAVFFVVLYVNLAIADRIAPTFRPSGSDDELLRRYQQVMDRRAGLVRASVALVCALLAGVGMSAQWQQWLLFRNAVEVGQVDPEFGVDLGFYLFELPFLTVVVDWVFASLVIVAIITTIAHYLNGGIRLQSPIERVTPQVKAHISVLLGLLALTKAVDYWLERYQLLFSTRGAVEGATYTDVNAQLPAIYLLLGIALLSFGLFIVNIRRRGWVLPVVAVGLWAFVALIAGTAYPAFVQRFQVLPAESSREAPFVERNIEATREAMGLSDVSRQAFDYREGTEVAAEAISENTETIRNAQLLDPDIVDAAFVRLQVQQPYFQMPDVDVDRYPIQTADGDMETTQAVLAARGLNVDGIQVKSWENLHLFYTHGYALALSAANGTQANGNPDFLVQNIPVDVATDADDQPEIDISVDRPELYVGEGMGGFAIVGTSRAEVTYSDAGVATDDGDARTVYEGEGGVPMGSFFDRAAFALRFGDWNVLVSDFVQPESEIIYVRDVKDRVEMLAPFLSYDADPYPVVADGRVYYVVDAYTTSDNYPYAQAASTDGLPEDSGLRHGFNYVRNSVKAVVDAYDGTVTFYKMGEDDWVLEAWDGAFPGLFTPGDQMSAELRAHVRYPQDLFRVQTTTWSRYHIDDPVEFLEQTAGWDVAQEPAERPGDSSEGEIVTNQVTGQQVQLKAERMDPYYQIVKLPGDAEAGMSLMRSFVPRSTDETSQKLTAFMAAKSDPDDYGQLVSYELPTNTQVDGPLQAQATIDGNTVISSRISLLNPQGQGSSVLFGTMLLLPMDDTFIYVRPLFVTSEGNNLPQLKQVIVVYGQDVVMEATLPEALAELFDAAVDTLEQTVPVPELGGEVPNGEGTDPPPDGTTSTTEPDDSTPPTTGEPSAPPSDDVATELAEVERLLAEADAALRQDGDLGRYQELVREAQDRLTALTATITTTTTSPPTTVAGGTA